MSNIQLSDLASHEWTRHLIGVEIYRLDLYTRKHLPTMSNNIQKLQNVPICRYCWQNWKTAILLKWLLFGYFRNNRNDFFTDWKEINSTFQNVLWYLFSNGYEIEGAIWVRFSFLSGTPWDNICMLLYVIFTWLFRFCITAY